MSSGVPSRIDSGILSRVLSEISLSFPRIPSNIPSLISPGAPVMFYFAFGTPSGNFLWMNLSILLSNPPRFLRILALNFQEDFFFFKRMHFFRNSLCVFYKDSFLYSIRDFYQDFVIYSSHDYEFLLVFCSGISPVISFKFLQGLFTGFHHSSFPGILEGFLIGRRTSSGLCQAFFQRFFL